MKALKFTLLLVLFSTPLFAQSENIINVHNRSVTSLNGDWKFLIDPYENGFFNYRLNAFDEMGNPPRSAYFTDSKQYDKTELLEYDWDTSPAIKVPGDWNHQDPRLEYYEGSVWYRKKFKFNKKDDDNRVFVHFGAVNYRADVYFNGEKLGRHIGGFTPFQYEVTDLIKEENSVVLMVNNNRHPEGVPTVNTDWWNFGGITRDVLVIETPETFIKDYLIQLDPKDPNTIKGYVQLDGSSASQKISINIPEAKLKSEFVTDSDGYGTFSIPAKKLEKWSPDDPKLYTVEISALQNKVTDKIGFRTVQTKGTEILLNGKPVFLKGISIHEENPYRVGRAVSEEDAELLLGWAKQLGCNFVRLAHYPHNEHMIRKANEMGIMVWEEVPVYWTIHWENPETYANAASQLETMIQRDKNSAATIIWSLANETPVSEPRNEFLNKFSKLARSLDNTRLLSAAMEVHTEPGKPLEFIVEDKLAEYVDIVSFNEYIGWYNGLPDKTLESSWKIPYDKPVFISEFGAGAKAGYHADSLTRFSEEYQADLYKKTLQMVDKIPNLKGFSPWILTDFRSPRRQLTGIQDGWNRKGLIGDQGEKKQAFFILQEYYQNKAEN